MSPSQSNEISEYEKERQDQIKKNEEFLKTLKLDTIKSEIGSSTKANNNTNKVKKGIRDSKNDRKRTNQNTPPPSRYDN